MNQVAQSINLPLQLLGGISPAEFMRKYWQKKPCIIRNAISKFKPLLSRQELFALSQNQDVESRLIVSNGDKWSLAHGPMTAKQIPSIKKPNWTLLVQGVDLHDSAVNELKNRFRFAPDARLDDLMISYATDGGGVGPHFDSYDVFLLQAHGTRRWRIGKQKDGTLQANVPLRILSNFKPELTFDLEPGDMLYLPPRYAHDGVAIGECMTYSIGFKVPKQVDLGRELLLRYADAVDEENLPDDELTMPVKLKPEVLYRDADQEATPNPAQIPTALLEFAQQAITKAMADPDALARHLGEHLSEPKSNVWFDAPEGAVKLSRKRGVKLALQSQMMFDARHIFLNGESWRAAGKDAKLMQKLANQRFLDARDMAMASDAAQALLQDWLEQGWLVNAK
ncbi:MAG TPA: cupin domain-containing protein [Burkholderiaceae bacterium]|nr:cupin domain-containing protein [Burkholderiaceae bacterium]